jgi:hypothetical protein
VQEKCAQDETAARDQLQSLWVQSSAADKAEALTRWTKRVPAGTPDPEDSADNSSRELRPPFGAGSLAKRLPPHPLSLG